MVGYNHKNSIFIPFLLFCHLKKSFERIICIFYPPCSTLFGRRNINFTFRISKWTVITNSHPMIEEWFASFSLFIHHLYSFVCHIFIANAPYIRKCYFFRSKVFVIYNIVTITAEEILHIIEITIASIEIFHIIAFTFEHASCGKLIFIVFAFHYTFTWSRWYTKG